MTDARRRPAFSGPEWTEAPKFEEVGAEQPVRYFLIAGPDGKVHGAMYLGTQDHFLGYIPKILETVEKWGQVCVTALRNSRWDGRKAFEYWADPANETLETYSVGPVQEARNVGELQVLVRDA